MQTNHSNTRAARPGLPLRRGVAGGAVAWLLALAIATGGAAQPEPPVPSPAQTPPAGQPVGLEDLLAQAFATYPSLAAARAARRQAEFQAVAAGALPSVVLNA